MNVNQRQRLVKYYMGESWTTEKRDKDNSDIQKCGYREMKVS